jgi:hypothetical protein
VGLDAYVRCRCWENGAVTSPPPHRQHVRRNHEGDLVLDLPRRERQDEHAEFEAWLAACCPHPNMEYAEECIGSWGGLRAFQSQLVEFGIEQLPTLRDVLPNANEGTVPADRSAAALAELDDFARRDFGATIVLIDAATSEALHEHVPLYSGWFLSAPGGWEGGVDPSGFVVRGPAGVRAWLLRLARRGGGAKQQVIRTDPAGWVVTRPSTDVSSRVRTWLESLGRGGEKREWFRSMRFRQEQLGPQAVRMTDERSGKDFVSPFGIRGSGFGVTYPPLLAVERRVRPPNAFDYILRPLRAVFRASVETGNPVHWT